jgi:hypothetical protein
MAAAETTAMFTSHPSRFSHGPLAAAPADVATWLLLLLLPTHAVGLSATRESDQLLPMLDWGRALRTDNDQDAAEAWRRGR